jgi:penicillin-binding protein 1A
VVARRLLLILGAVVVAAVVVVGVAAWVASPSTGGLGSRVDTRLRGTGGRSVPLSAIAPALQHAVVATEDERFYHHQGVDVLGVLRALPYDVTHLSLAQGASTITEQVGKLLYLNGDDRTPWRKLQDAVLALRLESRYGKAQILDAYLDSVYFGEGSYGAWAASEHYFGVPPARLGTAQASLLAGLIQAPSAYDPAQHPALARARQVEVLRSLVRNGFLDEKAAAAIVGRPLRLHGGGVLPPVTDVSLAPGSAFTWWQLSLGGAVALAGAAALAALRLRRPGAVHGLVVLRAASIVLVVLGIGVAIRAFRTA